MPNNRIKFMGQLVLIRTTFKKQDYTIILDVEDYTKINTLGKIYLQEKNGVVYPYVTTKKLGGAVTLSRIIYSDKNISRIYYQNYNNLDLRKSNIRLYRKTPK
ncbi:hypothetical protein EalM132_00026 [Exiguobacterium phage vB_EalM-132]|nr:hypothetical protein EalM132_00026 [Exiguobacterium phage vB_EalM-132]